MMEVHIAVEKLNKYATSESGDTVELIERPQGGISIVLADGQSSGRGAKHVSNMVTRKAISLLSEGIRDGAAARAASDFLYTERRGKVSSTLNILSVDMTTNTLVVTRNNPAPALISKARQMIVFNEASHPIGIYRNTRPNIIEIPLELELTACIYTDGLVHAGERYGQPIQASELFSTLATQSDITAQSIAGQMLQAALNADRHRPADDMSIVVLRVQPIIDEDNVRRMIVRLPLR